MSGLQLTVDLLQCGGLIVLGYVSLKQHRELSAARNLLAMETLRKASHAAAFNRLTDPEQIQKDMDQSATAVDTLLNKRKLAVRTDQQGPPAKVHRGKRYGARPGEKKYP